MDDSISPPVPERKNIDIEITEAPKKKIINFDQKEKNNIPIELSINAKAHQRVRVPELRGLSMRKAMSTLSSKGIVSNMSGSGKVAWQSPVPGTFVNVGAICKVGLE